MKFDTAIEYIEYLDRGSDGTWSNDSERIAEIMEDYAAMKVKACGISPVSGNEVAVCMCRATKPTIKPNGDWVCSFCGLP